jgi:micrococcal nuclease
MRLMAYDMSAIRWVSTTFAVGAICAVGAADLAAAADRLAGPYPAEVERVVDGDTLAVRVAIWLHQDLDVLVRIRGIDAPELRGRCQDEKDRAQAATVALEALVSGGEVALTAIEGDKYFGRVIADVATSAGENVGAALISGGYVRTYDGRKRESWCGGDIGGVETSSDLAALSEAPP